MARPLFSLAPSATAAPAVTISLPQLRRILRGQDDQCDIAAKSAAYRANPSDAAKRRLPLFYAAGVFDSGANGRPTGDALVAATGLAAIDLDMKASGVDLPPAEATRLLQRMKRDPFFRLLAPSPRGRLWGLVQLDGDRRSAYDQCRAYVRERYDLDIGNQSDIARGRFLITSRPDDVWLRATSTPWIGEKLNGHKATTDDIPVEMGRLRDITLTHAKAHLAFIDADANYNNWRRYLGALKIQFRDDGKQLAEDWSRTGSKWDAAEFERVWDSLDKSGTSYRTIIYAALEGGWKPDAATDAATVDEYVPDSHIHLHADRLASSLRPQPFLIDGLIPQRGLTALVGMPGDGKTLIAMEMVRAITTGTEFGGRKCVKGAVIYCCPDAPGSSERRMLALPRNAAKRVASVPELPRLPAAMKEFRQTLARAQRLLGRRVRLVVLDTYDAAREHSDGGYAGQDGTAEKVLRGLRRIASKRELAILIIHHGTRQDNGRARGTVVFDANMDWIANVGKDGNGRLMLRTIKNRDGGDCSTVGVWCITTQDVGGAPVPILQLASAGSAQSMVQEERGAKVLKACAAILARGDSPSLGKLATILGVTGKRSVQLVLEWLRDQKYMNSKTFAPTVAGRDWMGGE